MDNRFREIRDRYEDVVCGVNDYQMFQDIRALLGYIDRIHSQMVERAAEEAVQAALRSMQDGGCQVVH